MNVEVIRNIIRVILPALISIPVILTLLLIIGWNLQKIKYNNSNKEEETIC